LAWKPQQTPGKLVEEVACLLGGVLLTVVERVGKGYPVQI